MWVYKPGGFPYSCCWLTSGLYGHPNECSGVGKVATAACCDLYGECGFCCRCVFATNTIAWWPKRRGLQCCSVFWLKCTTISDGSAATGPHRAVRPGRGQCEPAGGCCCAGSSEPWQPRLDRHPLLAIAIPGAGTAVSYLLQMRK